MAIIAECECAKWFAVPQESEILPADFRREWRINGLLLAALARLQCEFAFENLRNNRGLFAMQAQPGSIQITDENANLEDQACMLWACSDVAMLAAGEGPNAIYRSLDVNRRFINLANELFEAIDANKDSLLENSSNQVLGQSIAIEALIWFACASDAQDLRARSLWMLREFADNLVRAQEKSEMVGNTLIDACSALRALIEAFRVTRFKTYAQTAAKIFDYIESQWWQRQPKLMRLRLLQANIRSMQMMLAKFWALSTKQGFSSVREQTASLQSSDLGNFSAMW